MSNSAYTSIDGEASINIHRGLQAARLGDDAKQQLLVRTSHGNTDSMAVSRLSTAHVCDLGVTPATLGEREWKRTSQIRTHLRVPPGSQRLGDASLLLNGCRCAGSMQVFPVAERGCFTRAQGQN
jgi:hypothetical protein